MQDSTLALLYREFPLRQPYDLNRLRQRAAQLARLDDGNYRHLQRNPTPYPAVVRVLTYSGSAPATRVLEVANLVDHPVTLTGTRWTGPGGVWEPMDLLEGPALPVTLPPSPLDGTPRTVRFLYTAGAADRQPAVAWHTPQRENTTLTTAMPSFPPRETPLLPPPTLKEVLSMHPFLRREPGGALRVMPGTWRVSGSLMLPRGVALHAGPGTHLRFSPSGALITNGPLVMEGSEEAPVVFSGLEETPDATWQGIAVLGAGAPSVLRHVVVRGTTGHRRGLWSLTGAVTFFDADVTVQDSLLWGNTAEDALNIVHSTFALHHVTIRDTLSDAFDGDFTSGTVTGCLFEDVRGDALDFSGSTVEVRDTMLRRIGDKGVSAGEASTLTVRGVTVDGAGIGLASKDKSILTAHGSAISNVHHAHLAAYVKKPVYGPATLEAHGVVLDGPDERIIVQQGSTVLVNGQQTAAAALDVKALYEAGVLGN